MKRKDFLKIIGAAGLGTPFLMNGMATRAMNNFLDLSFSCDGINDRVLVIVRLAGANDGLNMVIPVSQYSTYAALRPDIRISDTGTGAYINLDTTADTNKLSGLHPSMTAFKGLYDSGKLTLVNGVGYPSPNYSHFKSENTMFSGKDGTNNQELVDGMFGRYLSAMHPGLSGSPTTEFPDPLAIQFGNLNPSLFYGHTHEESIEYNVSGFQSTLFGQLGTAFNNVPTDSEHQDLLAYIRGVEASMDKYYNRVTTIFAAGSNSTVTYPTTDLGKQLRTVARLIKGGSKTKIFQVNLGGFDTHVNQIQTGSNHLGAHATLLGNISNSINAFQTDLENMGLAHKVMTVTFSEFGRQVRQNASLGTDHGDLSPFFVVGSNAQAGILGNHPVFTNTTSYYYNQNQRRHDYRQIFATLLQDWLGANTSIMMQTELQSFTTPALKLPLVTTAANAYPNCLIGAQYDNGVGGTPLASTFGISTLNRETLSDLLNNRNNGALVLESKTKGMVITKVSDVSQIITPVEGMIVFDTTEKCLKLYANDTWDCVTFK